MTKDLVKAGLADSLIVSDNRFLAGNFHFRFPASTAIVPDYRFERLVENDRFSSIAVVWQAGESLAMPVDLAAFLEETYGIRATEYPVEYFRHPYLFARTETVTLAAMIIPRPPVLDTAEVGAMMKHP
jgi:hypothetical protein